VSGAAVCQRVGLQPGGKTSITFTHSFLGIRARLRGKNNGDKNDYAVVLVLERMREELCPSKCANETTLMKEH
jgi:hypothetical protein